MPQMQTSVESPFQGNEGAREDESARHQTSPRKRKSISSTRTGERKKVSRACDACKEKKVRCAGTQPCPRCLNHSLQCLYNKAHRRGRPSTPEPGLPIQSRVATSLNLSSIPDRVSPDRRAEDRRTRGDSGTTNHLQDHRVSSRSSQEADGSRFEGDYMGPTSGIAFLHRAQKRLHRDFAAIKSKNIDGHGSQVSVYSFGDGLVPSSSNIEFTLPSFAEAKSLFDRYFEFAMPTYRFLHRPTVEIWLNRLFTSSEQETNRLSKARRAIVILIMATAKLYNESAEDMRPDGGSKQSEESTVLFAEAERLLTNETGPVRLESIQARLAQCIHLLASSRINQAWYIFGTTAQMISALGIHRRFPTNTTVPSPKSFEIDCRRRAFWSAYTLDRYFSVILGRPKIFRDEDIDQDLPDRMDESTGNSISTGVRASLCVADGPVFHARLAKILGAISSHLYPASRGMDSEWLQSAERWTAELKSWHHSLPAFLNPSKVDPSMLVPIFQRQSTVLRLGYSHALILANRPALLSNFSELNRWQGIPLGEPSGSLKECIDAALEVVITVDGLIEAGQMRKAFWFTHYISFCAISALYVYTIQQCLPPQNSNNTDSTIHVQNSPDTRHFEAAMKCQKRIEDTTTITSPFRRYNIILDELKKEVLHRLGTRSISAPLIRDGQDNVRHVRHLVSHNPSKHHSQPHPPMMDSSGGTPSITPTSVSIGEPMTGSFPFDVQQENNMLHFAPSTDLTGSNGPLDQASGLPALLDDGSSVIMGDLGAFGLQGELLGWSEFDSCAINWPEGVWVDDLEGGSL